MFYKGAKFIQINFSVNAVYWLVQLDYTIYKMCGVLDTQL